MSLVLIYNKRNNKNSIHSNQLTVFSFQESDLSKLLKHLEMLIGSYMHFFLPSKGWISFDGANILLNPVRSLSEGTDRSPGTGTICVIRS